MTTISGLRSCSLNTCTASTFTETPRAISVFRDRNVKRMIGDMRDLDVRTLSLSALRVVAANLGASAWSSTCSRALPK